MHHTNGVPIPKGSIVYVLNQEMTTVDNLDRELVIAFQTTEEPIIDLLDIDKLSNSIHDIGVLCKVENQTDKTFNLYAIKRVYLDKLTRETHDSPIYTSIEEVNEDFVPAEETIIEPLTNLIDSFSEESIATSTLTELQKTIWLVDKLNILADYFIQDNKDRLKYLITENHIEQFNLVIKHVLQQINSDPKLKLIINTQKRNKKLDDIFERFEQARLPTEVREHTQREIKKLGSLSKASTEYGLTLDYMNWILDIPWFNHSQYDYDINTVISALDQTHYGLQDIKRHILEYLTIEKLTSESNGTVLCFVGPPGTGKTSIAKQIATIAHRTPIRIALGGLSDEAEIRGHRRTFVNSRPGRLISGLKNSKSMNPIFILDELDKLSTVKGDPAAALLEVLDKEQNCGFVDRYIEVPVDLSKAFFICTANYEKQIPEALRDRMEIIQFRAYTKPERLNILESYLIPKTKQAYNIGSMPIEITDEAMENLASTEQVRQIEKALQKILRCAATDLLLKLSDSITIDNKYLNSFKNSSPGKKLIGYYK